MNIDICVPTPKGIERYAYQGIERALDAGCTLTVGSSMVVPSLRVAHLVWPENTTRTVRAIKLGLGNRRRTYEWAASGQSAENLSDALRAASRAYLRTFHSIIDYERHSLSSAQQFTFHDAHHPDDELHVENALDKWILQRQLIIGKKEGLAYVVSLHRSFDEKTTLGPAIAIVLNARIAKCFDTLNRGTYDAASLPHRKKHSIYDGVSMDAEAMSRSFYRYSN